MALCSVPPCCLRLYQSPGGSTVLAHPDSRQGALYHIAPLPWTGFLVPVFLQLWKVQSSQPWGLGFLHSPARPRARAGKRGSHGSGWMWPWSLTICVIVCMYPISFLPRLRLQVRFSSLNTLDWRILAKPDTIFKWRGVCSPRKTGPDFLCPIAAPLAAKWAAVDSGQHEVLFKTDSHPQKLYSLNFSTPFRT